MSEDDVAEEMWEGDAMEGGQKRKRLHSQAGGLDDDDNVGESSAGRCSKRAQRKKQANDDGAGSSSEDDVIDNASEDESSSDTKDESYPYIKTVNLKNFMCHHHLTTDLIPQINFIGGENGSGKSTILAAISFGLGVRADATGRGSSAKDFIGSHGDEAIVTLSIVQSKADICRHKMPGGVLSEQFFIERTISKNGQSKIKIMDSDRKFLSKATSDLLAIRQHLNIQVDNPVVCMSQKTAKEFLVNNDPARFYAFFLKATQIDKLIEAVRQAEDLQDQVLTTLEDYEFGFQEFLAKDYAPAKQAHEALAEAREVEDKKRIVQKELCNRWIQDAKAESQDLAAQKEKADENEKKALAKLEEHKADQKSNQDRLQMFKDEVASQLQRQQKVSQECAKVEAELRGSHKKVNDKENEKRAEQRSIDGIHKDIAHIKLRAREQKAEAAKLRAKKNPERPLSNLPDLQAKMDDLQGRRQHAREAKDQCESIDRDKGKERNDAKHCFDIIQNDMNRIQETFNRLDSVGKGNPLARLGNDVPKIAAAFREKEKMFPPGKAPIGPVGAFIKIKDPKWGLALCDATFGLKGGQTWLVHTLKDMETCKRILREKNIRENDAQFRTLNSDDLGDLKIGTASEPSILDVIEIDHPNQDCCRFIRNFLVDAYSINELRLSDTLDAAKAVVARPIESCRFPNGVTHELKRICYSLNNAKTAVERVQTMSKSGGLKSKFVHSNMANPYEVDVSAQKAQVQRQLNEVKQQYNEKKSAWEKVEADKRETMKNVGKAMKEMNETEKHIKDLEGKIRIEEATQAKWKDVDKDEQDEEIKALEDTSVFDDEIEDKGRQIELKNQEIERLSNEMEELKEARSAVEQRKQEADDRRLQVSREVAGASKELEELREALAGAHRFEEACKKTIEKYKAEANGFDAAMKQKEKAIEDVIRDIPESYDWQGHEPTVRTQAELHKEIAKLEKRKKIIEKNQDVHVVAGKYRKLQEKKRMKETQFDDLKNAAKSVKQVIKGSKKTKSRLLLHNKGCTVFNFLRNLSQKDYTGNIVFDDKSKTMEPLVRTNKTGEDEEDSEVAPQALSVKQLSGGERAFSGLCLVLALKEATTSPFLALDEPDVFMDEVLKMHNDSQSIIISPHSMITIPDNDPHIRKIIMRPVDRNQQRLPFAPVGADA